MAASSLAMARARLSSGTCAATTAAIGPMTMNALRALMDSTDQRDPTDMTEPTDSIEPIEITDRADPADANESTEPALPIESAEPTDPMDSTEPAEPIERSESSDHSDHLDAPTAQPASAAFTRPDTTLPSARPATSALTAFMAGPMSFGVVNPPSASTLVTMACSSSSSNPFGR